MESAPGHVDLDVLREALRGIDGVDEVHELHVWSISSGMVSLSCHLIARSPSANGAVLVEARTRLAGDFGIHHVTIQVESGSCAPDVHA